MSQKREGGVLEREAYYKYRLPNGRLIGEGAGVNRAFTVTRLLELTSEARQNMVNMRK